MPEDIQQHVVFKIGDWTVDSLAHTVVGPSEQHRLPPKVMAVLVILAQRYGELVTRNELIDAVWEGNAYVGDNALNNAMWRIRQLLEGDADAGETVKTVPKMGYQLLSEPTFLTSNPEQASIVGTRAPMAYFALAAVGILVIVAITSLRDKSSPAFDDSYTVVTQLPGRELYAAPSPDGSRFAFMHVSPTDGQDIYLQSLAETDAAPERLTSGPERFFTPTWAPDGQHLAFLRIAGDRCEVVVRNTQQDDEEAIDTCIDVSQRTLSWSPDGRWLVYRKDEEGIGPGLYLRAMNNEFRPREEVYPRRISCIDCLWTDEEVSWTPDSKKLAVTRHKSRMSEDVFQFDIDDWTFKRLTYTEKAIEGHTWDKEGRNLLYVSNRHSLDRKIWVVDSVTQEKRALGFEGAGFPVYLPDNNSIMFYRRQSRSYVAAVPVGEEDIASHFPRPVVQSSGSDRSPSYSEASGQLTYYSNLSGYNEVWVSDTEGIERRQITNLKSIAVDPSWSPDGTRISFVALDKASHEMAVYVYDAMSDSSRIVAAEIGVVGFPTWSADGQSLIVPLWRGNTVDLWRISIDGNQLIRVTSTNAAFGRESSDGRYLFYTKSDARGLFRSEIDGSSEIQIVADLVSSGYGNWTLLDSNTILYSRRTGGYSEIVRYNHLTGERKALVRHPGRTMSRYGMLTYSKSLESVFFTHLEPQQIDILMAPDPLAAKTGQ